jgi:1,4-dihydroxy-2-naphthoate octaprenyltransferase
MGIGAGLFLIALGAIFAFAVTAHVDFISLHAVGWILMVIGLAGILLSVLYWGPRRRASATTRDRVYTDDPTQPPPPL